METKDEKPTYAVYSETNFDDMETWLTFIAKEGNEKNLSHLKRQLDQVDWNRAPEYTGTFALDLTGVSSTTAKEMMKIGLNTRYDPNKFEGPVKHIDFKFRKKDSNETKAIKVYEMLGEGVGCEFFGDEDLEGCSLVGSDEEESYSDYSESESVSRREVQSLNSDDLPAMLKNKKRVSKK